MKRSRFRTAALLALFSLNGLSTANAALIAYHCADGSSLQVEFTADAALLAGPGGKVELPQVVSASGAHYQRGPLSLFTRGREAALDNGRDAPRQCRSLGPLGHFVELSGSVSYLARIALPPDATLTLRLRDEKRRLTLVEQDYELAGAQVPIPFRLAVDRSLIGKTGGLVLSARIEAGGRLRFVNERTVVRLRDGDDAHIDLLLRPAR